MHRATENKSEFSSQSQEPTLKRKTSEEEIRSRAYQIFISRDRKPGRAMEDWLQAERELLSRN